MDDSLKTKAIIKEMALLFANYLEVINLLNEELSKENNQPLKYYLLPKEWLEDYKIKKNYNSITANINPYMFKNYSTFKDRLEDEKSFNSTFSNIEVQVNNELYLPPNQDISAPISNSVQQNIYPPRNFVPVKEEIINEYMSYCFDFNNKNLFLYDVFIGEEIILVLDNKNKLNIFICSYDIENEYFNVDSILSFKEEIGINEMIKSILNKGGIKHYYNEKNINVNSDNEQQINDDKGNKIGIYYNLNNSNSIKDNNVKTTFYFKDSIMKKTSNLFNNKGNDNNKTKYSIQISGNYYTSVIQDDIVDNDNDNDNNNDNINNKQTNEIIPKEEFENNINNKKLSIIKTKINENKPPLESIHEENSEYQNSYSESLNFQNNLNQNTNLNQQNINIVPNYKNNYQKKYYIINFYGDLYCYSHLDYNNLKNNLIISDFENQNYSMGNNNNYKYEQNIYNQYNYNNMNNGLNNNNDYIGLDNRGEFPNNYNDYINNIQPNNQYDIHIINSNDNINNYNNQQNSYFNNNNYNINFAQDNYGKTNSNNYNNNEESMYSDSCMIYNYKKAGTFDERPNINKNNYINNESNNINKYNGNLYVNSNVQIQNSIMRDLNRYNSQNLGDNTYNNNIMISSFNDSESKKMKYNNNTNKITFNNNRDNNYYNYQNIDYNNQNMNNNMNLINNNKSINKNILRNRANNANKNNLSNNKLNSFNNFSAFKTNIKESVFSNDEICLSLYSDQLNKESKMEVKIDQKLRNVIEIFKTYDWVNQYPIKNIHIDGVNLNLDKTLIEQGIFKDTRIKIEFTLIDENNT